MSKLETIRNAAASTIKGLLAKYGIECLYASDIDAGSSPVVHRDPCDDNNTMTLDEIEVCDGALSFSASSCSDNAVFDIDTIRTDALVGIAEWLENKEGSLSELSPESHDSPSEQPEEQEHGKGRHRLTVIFGSSASEYAEEHGLKKTVRQLARGYIEGACEEYLFDTEDDLKTACQILQDADGWMGSWWKADKKES